MLSKREMNVNQQTRKTFFLNSIGSNIFSSSQNAVIWGSGSGAKDELNGRIVRLLNMYTFRRLDVRAVRGPITRERLLHYGHNCSEIYGDPAILMPLIYESTSVTKRHKILFIPQFLAEKEIRQKYPDLPMVSMNTNDYKYVIDEISASEKVVTSSLHGIILAEAYGVPAVYFKTLNKTLKFEDYYASTGRYNIHFSESLEEALTINPLPIPNLTKLQKGLVRSFPYDIWKE